MRHRLLLAFLLATAALLGTAVLASAHGEDSQEGFLRMETVAFSNVQFSTDTGKQGEMVTITGQATILDTSPRNLGDPGMGYINITAPGPVMLMKDRVINGAEAADAIFVKKGDTYDFKMTLAGRLPGRWHVHPTFAVEGAGTLIGPGQWITVQDTGGFANNLNLLNGQTVNLETFGVEQLTIFQWLGFAIGRYWMLYWTLAKGGIFDPQDSTLVMDLDVTNTGKSPMNVTGFTTSSLTFVSDGTAGTGSQHTMSVEPQGQIAPGETKTLKLTLRDPAWRDARIIDVNRPRIEVAGQLVFQDSSGTKNQDTILSSINPKLV